MPEYNYRLIFIDDEHIVREGIKTRINWGKNGFDLVDTFENGFEALKFISDNPVDIVISDIYMPQMDGLQLSKIIYEKYPQIMVIILTGYDHFEYAQQAIRYRVKDFLLKPLTAEEFEKVLLKAKIELDRIREEKKNLETLKTTVKKTVPLLKEQFLREIIKGELQEREIAENISLLKWDSPRESFFKVLTVLIPETTGKNTRERIIKQITAIVGEADETFFNYDNCIVVILYDRKRHTLEERSLKTAREIFNLLVENYSINPIVGSGEIIRGIENLVISCNDAKNAMEYASILDLSVVISIREIKNKRKLFPDEYFSMIRKIGDTLYSQNRKATQAALEDIFTYLEKHYLTKEELTIFFAQLQFSISTFMQEMGITPKNTPTQNQHELNLHKYDKLTTIKEYFLNLIEKIEGVLNAAPESSDVVMAA